MDELRVQETVPETEQKLFTQEEVDHIIKSRLSRFKTEQKENEQVIEDRVSAAISERTTALDKKEKRLDCKAYLIENGYSSELLDLFDTSDVKTFKDKVESAQRIYSPRYPIIKDGGEVIMSPTSDLSSAFKKPKPHKPKEFVRYQ